MQHENQRLNELVVKLEARVDDGEQRSRNGCLLVHGIEETDEEDTDTLVLDTFKNHLNLVNMELNHIQRSHRVGPKKSRRNTRTTKSTPRPIIVRFASYRERALVFRSKKRLKGKAVSISENLTQTRYHLLNAAKAKFGRENVWSSDGRIMTKLDNEYKVINSLDDLNNNY